MSADVQELLGRVVTWTEQHDEVLGVALVGSQALGTARPDSDVDLVILFKDPLPFLEWPHRLRPGWRARRNACPGSAESWESRQKVGSRE